MRRILLTGCGGAAAINVARSIEAINLDKGLSYETFGVDKDPYKLLRAETDEKWLLGEGTLIENLNGLIKKLDIDFVHAQPWRDVLEISKNRDKLKAKTFLPNHQTILTCTDKYLSYKAWRKAGIKVPETKIIMNKYDGYYMFRESKEQKFWIREIRGAGGLGAVIINNIDEWERWMYSGYHRTDCFTIAEYLSPRSVTWMSVWNEGELIVGQGRERLYWEGGSKFLSGVSGVTGAAKTVSDEQVDSVALRSIFAVDKKPHGIFSVDMTYDKEGTPNPTEINIGKFFTTVNFFTRFGLNMPEIYLDLAFGDEVESKGINPLPEGLVQIRGVDIEPVYTTVEKLG